MSNYLSVVVFVDAKPGCGSALEAALLSAVAPSRLEEGCIEYRCHKVHGQDGQFVFYETWASKALMDAHLESPHVKALIIQCENLLAKPLDIIFCDEMSAASVS
jgi:quinol monooxygenase YgiN